MLELIESDQFEKLPGGVFARSFVRQYARAVGLDPDEMGAELAKVLTPEPERTKPERRRVPEILVPQVSTVSQHSRFSSGSALPSLALVVLAVLICSGAYSLWLNSNRQAAGAPVETVKTPVQPAAPPSTATAVSKTEPPTAETAPPSDSGTSTTNNASGALKIALTAEEETWVRATENGKVVFSGVLQPNETKALSAGDTVTLRLGNAGGVTISLNGKTIPAVGPRGQVRIVQLSPDGAVQVEPSVKPQPASEEQKTHTL